ncbi:hypothetical protein DYH09_29450 [bacterium CPR1]|nr:hypothetical protein [bacterium CPR1]
MAFCLQNRRPRVQILSPLPTKTRHRAGFLLLGGSSLVVTTNRFPTNLELSRVARQLGPGEGERVEAKDQGDWWPARVVRREGDRVLVRWQALGFDTAASDEWKKPQQVRSLASGTVYPEGTRVEVKWKGKLYPAVVVKEEDGIHLVHYLDYGSEWDEWVPAWRIKRLK